MNNEFQKLKSKETIEIIKNKLRKEMTSAINKENYLNPEDAKLINEFINKIQKELLN